MTVTSKKIEDIKPYENNPRKNQRAVSAVAKSIKEFGFKVPIIIDKNNVIVAGHTRIEAAKSLGIDSVPCIVADDLTDAQVRAYRLVDNKVAELAEWDMDILLDEIEKIGNSYDISDFGFDAKDFEALDLDDAGDYSAGEQEEMHKCPKCGFEFSE